MIHILEWDSKLFNRKMAEIDLTDGSLFSIETLLQKAKEDAVEYITCKLQNHNIGHSKYLESLGFYLSDIRITWAMHSDMFSRVITEEKKNLIRAATGEDIPVLKEMIKSLFSESLYYNDPFFSREEADRMYQTWIVNSVRGQAADAVLYIPYKAFITCKKISADEGRIVLIGVRDEFRGKSLGKKLMREALKWFQTRGVSLVWVRTQLNNLAAMNFYNKSGFYIKEYDMVYAKIM